MSASPAPKQWSPIVILCPCGAQWTTRPDDPPGFGGTRGSRLCESCRKVGSTKSGGTGRPMDARDLAAQAVEIRGGRSRWQWLAGPSEIMLIPGKWRPAQIVGNNPLTFEPESTIVRASRGIPAVA